MSLSHRRIGIQMISNNEISKCCTRQGLVTTREEVGDEMWGEEVLGGAIHRSTGPFQWELLHYQMGNEEIPVKRRAPPVLILLPSSSSAQSHSVLLSSLSPSLLMMTYKQEDVEFKQRRDDCANNCHPSEHINYTTIHPLTHSLQSYNKDFIFILQAVLLPVRSGGSSFNYSDDFLTRH